MGWYFDHLLEMAQKPERPGDATAARELRLYIKNMEPKYVRYTLIARNLRRKAELGRYDPSRAAQAFEGLCRDAAKDYCREYANAAEWQTVFNPTVRRITAQLLVDDFRAEFLPAATLPGQRSGLCRLAEEGGAAE